MGDTICKRCNKKYTWSIAGTVYPGGKEKEEIICPYSGEINGYEMTSAFVESYRCKDK